MGACAAIPLLCPRRRPLTESTKLVKKRWYSTNLGALKCSSRRARLSLVGRQITMAFKCRTDSGAGDSRFSTKNTCLERMSCMEVTRETIVLVSLSSSRHFMPFMERVALRGARMFFMSIPGKAKPERKLRGVRR